jgi:hypothetical protein
MYPGAPAELMETAMQMAMYFATAVGAFVGLLMCRRA